MQRTDVCMWRFVLRWACGRVLQAVMSQSCRAIPTASHGMQPAVRAHTGRFSFVKRLSTASLLMHAPCSSSGTSMPAALTACRLPRSVLLTGCVHEERGSAQTLGTKSAQCVRAPLAACHDWRQASCRHAVQAWRAAQGTLAPACCAGRTCVREFMTSISCSVTTCTTSLRFCSSPSGHCTNLVVGPAAHRRRHKDLL